MVKTTGGAQGSVLAQVADGDVGVFAVGILDEIAEDSLVVVTNEEDFGDLGDSGDSIEAVLDDGLAGDFEEGLFGATWLDRVFVVEGCLLYTSPSPTRPY